MLPNALSDDDCMEFEKYLCETDLAYLCKKILKFKDWATCHDDLNKFLKTNYDSNRKLILIPREHLKTSVVTIAQTIQILLKNPNASILICNLVLSNAEKMLFEIKDYLSSKSTLRNLYGNFVGDKWNTNEIIIKQRTSADKTPSISIGSPDSVVTSQHYDYIFLDDILDDSVLGTPEQVEKTMNFYRKILDLLKRPDGKLTVVGTRWHDRDLYGHIIKNLKEEYTIYEKGATEDGTIDGAVIFPNKFTTNILKQLLKEKGSYSFFCQYFNKPIMVETQHFKPPFRYWSELGDNCEHTITVDLASTSNASSDYNVIMDACVTGSNQMCVFDYFRSKCGVFELIEKLFAMAIRSRVKKVGIESVAYQRIFANIIEEECRKRNVFFKVIPIVPHRDKFSRIMALQPRYESGNLLLKQGMHELEDEFSRFPVGEHDDILDSLAMQLNVIQPRYETKPKVYIPPEYRSEKYAYA